tara:strand:+ start:1663 stop:2124 length:462 start_codon:yes stop_codon:yes gene_type:complete
MKYEKHGMQGTPIYEAWCGIKRRCYNKSSKDYNYYGGRGIKVCDKWKDSFLNFYRDMGEKPNKTYSIDRINVYGDYTPDNCRWADKTTQSINQRTRKDSKSGYKGVAFINKKGKFVAYIKIKGIQKHLGYYTDKNNAIKARKEAELKYFKELI